MGLKKGMTNNRNGRPKGSVNKATAELREVIIDFLQLNFEKITKDIAKMNPRERVKAYTELLQYGLPKLASTSMDINFDKMSDDDLDKIVIKLLQNRDGMNT